MDLAALRKRLAAEEGISLIELLVTMIMAIIVTLALFAFQDVTLNQTSRVFARVDATQSARSVVEGLESKLHSACVAENVTPILAGSTDTSLSFISKYGSANTIVPDKHVVALNTTTNALTDTVYAVSGGSAPNWTFSSTPTSTTTLATNVMRENGTVPVFKYYAYGLAKDSGGRNYVDSSGNPYMILLDGASTLPSGITTSTGTPVPAGTTPFNSPTALTVPLSAPDAKIASAVTINMDVGPPGSLGTNGRYTTSPVTLSDQVTLRLTPVPSEGNLPSVPPCA
jgi:Tfp pilus assembly protein PilV